MGRKAVMVQSRTIPDAGHMGPLSVGNPHMQLTRAISAQHACKDLREKQHLLCWEFS